jgi:hypothetical protein
MRGTASSDAPEGEAAPLQSIMRSDGRSGKELRVKYREADNTEENMSNLYVLISKIKKAPAMYLGWESVICLQSFLSGYSIAQYELGATPTLQDKDFEEFPNWLRQKFSIQTSQSWASILLFYSEDEQKALALFFEVFDEFVDRRQSSIEQTDAQQKAVA